MTCPTPCSQLYTQACILHHSNWHSYNVHKQYINGIAEAAVPVDATAVAVAPADKADSTLTTPALTPVPSRDGTSGATTPTKVDYLPTFTREDTLVYNIISNNPIRIATGHTTLGE